METTMSEHQAWELLRRGGTEQQDGSATKYNGLADPAGAEELAGRLAGLVRDLEPTVILVWEDPEDVLLGHVVGRELSLPVVRAYNAEGLVGHSAGMPDHPQVVRVADAVRDATVVRAARALAEQQGGALAGVAVLLETSELRDVGDEAGRLISLVQVGEAQAEGRADGA
jgi:adenine/guanine phosphoribosyltransferase-like PRPP-binding protein